jgi:CDP-diglyceride synthetase
MSDDRRFCIRAAEKLGTWLGFVVGTLAAAVVAVPLVVFALIINALPIILPAVVIIWVVHYLGLL